MQPIETFKVGDLVVEVYQDEDHEGPDECGDDAIFLVANVRRYLEVRDRENAVDWMDTHEIFPVHGYAHSGIVLSLAPFRCPWDSGIAGFVAVSKAEFPEESRRIVAEHLVETWNQHLSGDVYGYRVFREVTCDLGHVHREEVDSCWGFYGLETVREEARIAASWEPA